MSVTQLKDVLQKEGIEEINPVNELFNPEEHEVVDVQEGEEENKIITVVQKGYALHGKVIRPARVKVIKRKEL